MKKLSIITTLISNIFFLLPTSALGAMMVNAIQGGGVFVSQNAHTDIIRIGDHIPEGAEIFTEEGAQVTLSDYYDHKYHLSGSTHIKIMKKNIELKGGFLWYQSFAKSDRDNHLFQIQTANAKVQYDKGEAILSFDPFSGKSQLLVIKGYNLFSNRHKIGQSLEVKSGYFSFIQNDHENGNPRLPTPVSSTSYQKVTSLFNDIEPPNFLTVERFKVQTPKKRKKSFTGERKLASVSAPVPVAITVEKTNPIPSGKNMFENTAIEVRPTTHKAHRIQTQTCSCPCPCPDQRRTDRQTSSKKQHSSVEVHIYRPSQQNHSSIKTPKILKAPTAVKKKPKKQIYSRPKIIFRKTASLPKRKKQVNRGPASIPPLQITPEAESNPFEAALKKEYQKQARHDREVNELIDALKSVDMDYKKNY